MKTHIRSAALAAFASAIALSVSLRAEDAGPVAEFVDPNSAEARSYRVAGTSAIDRLVVTMVTDAAAAVSKGGEVAALATFHLKDVPKKDGLVAGLPRITDMKLTSFKVRNPENAPDAAEKVALYRFRGELEQGNPPRVIMQKITHEGGAVEWRVYKPLANVKECGVCHGNPDDMSADLRQALAAKFPDDQGTGFAQNEWRGLIRVTVADPPPAAKPVTGAQAAAKK